MESHRMTIAGFTLVELLAVIVILCLILIIAVPKVQKTLDNSKKRTLELSVKAIARSAEEAYIEYDSFGITDEITCESVSNVSMNEYKSCKIDFDAEGNASVTYSGKGSYDGMYVCGGTKTNVFVTDESCTLRLLTVELDGGTDTVDYKTKYESGSTITLDEPTKEGYAFDGWIVTGIGASVDGNKLTMGTENTTITAVWKVLLTSQTLITKLCADTATCTENGLIKDIDGNIRYYGSNPNNYIEFNGEVWRIIGVFNVKANASDTDAQKQLRIKIIRNDILGEPRLFDENSNKWIESDLNLYLNGDTDGGYYYSLNQTSKTQISKVVWNTGQLAHNGEAITPEDAYTSEKGAQVAESIIGLISVSDFGYSGTNCMNVINTSCTTNNWLKPEDLDYWAITPRYAQPYYTWNIGVNEGAKTSLAIRASLNIRPVVYLNSDIVITGTGENTEEGIYKIL